MRFVRHGMGAVRPYIYGHMDTAKLVSDIFGAEEIERLEMGTGAHIEARISDAMIVLEVAEPPPPGGTPASVYVYVPDVDEVIGQAKAAGFDVIADVENKPYQERAGGLKDRYGNIWWVSTFLG